MFELLNDLIVAGMDFGEAAEVVLQQHPGASIDELTSHYNAPLV